MNDDDDDDDEENGNRDRRLTLWKARSKLVRVRGTVDVQCKEQDARLSGIFGV